jgi:hypothetical protein
MASHDGELSAEVKAALAEPFDPGLVEWKPQVVSRDGTRALAAAYVDQREYQKRLDAVVPGWGSRYDIVLAAGQTRDANGELWPVNKVFIRCILTVAGISREDVGECDLSDDNALTSASAQAFKRACTAFGLGRYLYETAKVWADYDRQTRTFTTDGLRQLTATLPGAHGGIVRAPAGNGADDPPWGDSTPAERGAGNGGGNGNGGANGNGKAAPAGDVPNCPKCGGPMWDNRNNKTNPKAPDFKCKNRGACDGAIWLHSEKKAGNGKAPAAAPSAAPATKAAEVNDEATRAAGEAELRRLLEEAERRGAVVSKADPHEDEIDFGQKGRPVAAADPRAAVVIDSPLFKNNVGKLASKCPWFAVPGREETDELKVREALAKAGYTNVTDTNAREAYTMALQYGKMQWEAEHRA